MHLPLMNNSVKILFGLGLSLVFFSCDKPLTNEKPEGLLNKALFEEMLYEVHLLEGIVVNAQLDSKDGHIAFDSLFQAKAEEMETDTAAFNRSFDYYLNDPVYSSDLYERMADKAKIIARKKTAMADSVEFTQKTKDLDLDEEQRLINEKIRKARQEALQNSER